MQVKTIHSRKFYILYITLPPDPGILITSRDEELDMILKSLTERLILKTITGDTSVDITNLDTDSREIRPGGLFVCVPGFHVDGHDYARQAIRNGAVAIVAERGAGTTRKRYTYNGTGYQKNSADSCKRLFGDPTRRLKLIGITGTNGKTTTTHMVEKILNDAHRKTGIIGTLYMKIGDHMEKTLNTTPDTIQAAALFSYDGHPWRRLCRIGGVLARIGYGESARMRFSDCCLYEFVA